MSRTKGTEQLLRMIRDAQGETYFALRDGILAGVEELEREKEDALYFLRMIWLQIDEDRPDGPGHSHSEQGIWDRDNGDMAGKPCEWCAMWRDLRRFIVAHNAQGNAPETAQKGNL